VSRSLDMVGTLQAYDVPVREAARASALIDHTCTAIHENLSGRLDPLAAAVFSQVLARARYRPNASTIGRLFGSLRQLERDFVNASLPPPGRLVVLARWLPVGHVLATNRVATRALAGALSFSSTQALCRAAIREIRMSIPELRSDHAVDRIAHDLITAYAGLRSRTHASLDLTSQDGNELSRVGHSAAM
jgi:hypothetical protein